MKKNLMRNLCLGVILLSTAEFLIATTGVQIRHLPDSTDFATYYLAADMARQHQSPYDERRLQERGYEIGLRYESFPFLYPPPFAFIMQPLSWLSYPRARQVWMLITTVLLMASLSVWAHVFRRYAQDLGLATDWRYWLTLAVWFPCALNSTSVHNDIRAGSVGITLLFTTSVLTWSLRARPWLAGGSAVFAALLKLTPVAFIPYVALRLVKQRRTRVLAMTIGLAAALLLSWNWWDAGVFVEYYDALLHNAQREIPRGMNQSLDAFFSRLLVPSDRIAAPLDFPGLKNVLSMAASLLLAVFTLRRLLRRRPALFIPVEIGLLTVTLLLVMKITWLHTLSFMLFLWPLLMLSAFAAAERDRPWARRLGALACLGFFLSSAHLPVLWLSLRQGWWSLAISAHVYGLVLLWGATAFVLGRALELQNRDRRTKRQAAFP